jgi:hypothetical protein
MTTSTYTLPTKLSSQSNDKSHVIIIDDDDDDDVDATAIHSSLSLSPSPPSLRPSHATLPPTSTNSLSVTELITLMREKKEKNKQNLKRKSLEEFSSHTHSLSSHNSLHITSVMPM